MYLFGNMIIKQIFGPLVTFTPEITNECKILEYNFNECLKNGCPPELCNKRTAYLSTCIPKTNKAPCFQEKQNFDMCIIMKQPVNKCEDILKSYHKCLDKEIKDK